MFVPPVWNVSSVLWVGCHFYPRRYHRFDFFVVCRSQQFIQEKAFWPCMKEEGYIPIWRSVIPPTRRNQVFLIAESECRSLVVGWLSMLTSIMSMVERNERIVWRTSLGLPVLLLFAVIGLLAITPSEIFAADLSPKTVKEFNDYVAVAEARMKHEESRPDDFLYIEALPRPQFDSIMATLKRREVYVQQIHTRDTKGNPIDIPAGMIHHWVGDVFIPGTSLSSALKVLRDYDNFKNIYKPEVVRSRLVGRNDSDDYKVYLRLQKKSIVTVTLDTWYDIHFMPVGKDRGYSRSISTRIQQVEDAGTSSEHLDPVGQDSGYLWRINSYWRYERRDNGVIIEWESISLSRPIPFLLAWFVKPLIRKIARETVQDMLTATRKAVMAEKSQETNPQVSRFAAPSVQLTQVR
jgi:hypothetical protein